MKVIRKEVFILWDDKDGYDCRKVYLDAESAEIGLIENYTGYWIYNNKAKVETIEAVQYTK